MISDLKTKIRHSDTDITPIFARMMDGVFGGKVSILPNVAVLNECRRQTRRGNEIELSVVADSELGSYTIYQAGRSTLLIVADDNRTIDLADAAQGEDESADLLAVWPALAPVLESLR
jgi:hypothetical protein